MTVPLEKQKNIADVKVRVREQLGLGSAAVSNAGDFATTAQGDAADSALQPSDIGTGAGTVAAGDDSRIVKAVQYAARSGDTNSTIQDNINGAASGSSVLSRLSGNIALDADVVANGRVPSFDIDPGTVFTGTGNLPSNGSPTFYNPFTKNIQIARVKGTPTAPVTEEKDPVASFVKFTNFDPSVVPGINAALVAINYKYSTAAGAAAQGIFAEAVDPTGWGGAGLITFVEGLRAHGICTPEANNGSSYGAVLSGIIQGGKPWKVVAGIEAEALLFGHSVSQPGWSNFNPGDKFATSFNATTGGDVSIDTLYATNPFMTKSKSAATGFAVTNNSVWDRAFASNAVCNVGIDLSLGSYSQGGVLLPNNNDIRARKTDGSGYVSLIYLEAVTDKPVIGSGSSQVVIPTGAYIGGGLSFGMDLIPTGNGTQNLGSASFRMGTIYASTGTINTSDANHKSVRGDLNEAEIAVAKSIPIKAFRFKDAIEKKGQDTARLHIGVIAQEVIAAFEKNGLDAFAYGVVGCDKVTKLVTRTRLVPKPVLEEYEEEYVDFIEKDGTLILSTAKRKAERAKLKELPIFDDLGQPVMGPVDELDDEGNRVLEETSVVDPTTGQPVIIKKPRKKMSQMTRSVPVMENVEEEYTVEEVTNEKIYSVRYEELAMFMIAALRR